MIYSPKHRMCQNKWYLEITDSPKFSMSRKLLKSYLPLLLFGSTVWTIVNCGCWGGCVITKVLLKIIDLITLILHNNFHIPVWIAPVVGSCICITCCITKGWTPPLAIVPFTIIWVPPDVGISICCGWAKIQFYYYVMDALHNNWKRRDVVVRP